ncbi:MAG: dephospho-CoA kinase [Pseudomonadota bacterium]
MIILGLTGSIGMGKSTTAAMFAAGGVPVYDADAAVHELYAVGGAAVAPVGEIFPTAIVEGAVDRDRLRALVVEDTEALGRLNQVVHPLVAESQIKFRERALAQGAACAVLDIPLLFETGGNARCDYVAVVTAPADVQRQRVLARDGMTEDTFQAILGKQLADSEKRARADLIISTAFGFEFARTQVDAILGLMRRLHELQQG